MQNKYVQEALALMRSYGIAETTIESILEMTINKKLLQQAADREHALMSKEMDKLNRAEQLKAVTGRSPITPEVHKQIEQKAEKYGNKEALLQRKIQQRYGNET